MTPEPNIAPAPLSVRDLDSMDALAASQYLRRCCGADRWVEEVLRRRPFGDLDGLLRSADAAADPMVKEDWLQAFSHHPRIGDLDDLRRRFATTATWSEGEQVAVTLADETVLKDLAAANDTYEERFGYIFIVCASGKSAAEMLVLLQERLGNSPDEEWRIAAQEQRQITRLRLQKLVSTA